MSTPTNKTASYDPFQSFLCENAEFTPGYDLIRLKPTGYIPEKLIAFSCARNPKTDNPDAAVCFYEDDAKFWAFVRSPKKYLPLLKRHPAVIMPDISTNFDMPTPVKWHSVFQNYALAHWMQEQGLTVIPNARPVLPFSPDATLGGMPRDSVICIGAHGNQKNPRNRERFADGVREVCDFLQPKTLLVYGSDRYDAFEYPRKLGIPIVFYTSQTEQSHNKKVN